MTCAMNDWWHNGYLGKNRDGGLTCLGVCEIVTM